MGVTQTTDQELADWFSCEHATEACPVVLYVYGGTFVMNPGPSHKRIAERLAAEVKGQVLMPAYALAPEHPFPLAIEDIVAAYRSLLAQGIAANRIVFACDTAGAAIALSALVSLRDQGDLMPAGAAVIFPWVDLTMMGGTYVSNIKDDGRVSDLELLATLLSDYLQGADPADPVASPVFADLRNLPPMNVHANVTDILADDARLLAERAKGAQVPVQLSYWDDVPETLQKDQPFSPQMEAIFSSIGHFVRAHSGRQSQAHKVSSEGLQEDYLEIVEDNIQPHMRARVEEMFAWSKEHGPDWVWSFIEKRLALGAVVTQHQLDQDWFSRIFSDYDEAMILLTASRYILHANKCAEESLEHGSYLRRRNGRLVGVSTEVDVALDDVLQKQFLRRRESQGLGGTSFTRFETEPHAPLFLRCYRLEAVSEDEIAPPVAMLRLLMDDEPPVEIDQVALCTWYGLSPREAELAARFVSGTPLADYASEMGVSMATVRTQFSHIKSKLGAADQAAVVRKILRVAALNH
ncbi:alpha/beta hydrolase fold domain-containing protein [Parvibaculaceae bacterium PLY_AMNH_Bact1]|nr:alpha/beta hydrolase fold domain-containing protein [Parvibaculaceae bacterium PLY_AMNH_Bact1]